MIKRNFQLLSKLIKLNHRQLFYNSYASQIYKAWKLDKNSVSEEWNRYFTNNAVESIEDTQQSQPSKQKSLVLAAFRLIRYYESRGHQLSNLDPLNLKNYSEFGKVYVRNPVELDIKQNYNAADINIPFRFPKEDYIQKRIAGFIKSKDTWTLKELVETLKIVYCGKIGIQYMHISEQQQKLWLMSKIQEVTRQQVSKDRKIKILQDLTRIQCFNAFLADKLKTSKRFGVEGNDTLISGLNALVDQAAKNGVDYVGFGMAHRGRLNALANVFKKPMEKIFAEFQQHQQTNQGSWGNSGDVKYHLGATNQLHLHNHKIRLSILPNPSHLQTVNPVLMGNIKAVQDHHLSNGDGSKIIGVLIHGDAALAGQGIVYQCLQMENLDHYKIYGIIHVVANNQIGFTTTPAEARTGLYCTDVAKSIQAPIIHVNGDHPEEVDKVMRLAFQYRQKFKKDIFVDIIGYRRFGHNQQDQPAFTQPMMYQEIHNHKRVYQLYSNELINNGIITQQIRKSFWDHEFNRINSSYLQASQTTFNIRKWVNKTFHRVVDLSTLGTIKDTGVQIDTLKNLGNKMLTFPGSIKLHPQIQKIFDARKTSIESGKGIDFATAQSLAFASLLHDGFGVRLSGQDVERGTFSHRHAVVTCQQTGNKFSPIRNVLQPKDYNQFQIQNSLLSEYAALGYQYGYSITNPNTLTIWQAQFGDFANGAQIIIDNYLASGQSKWGTQTGLVLNLPHGMDGQGPQHSSGRMERFLQLMSDDVASIVQERKERIKRQIKHSNMQVVNCSFAANYFHALRRQVRRDFRKPLINFVSKKLLKYTPAMSDFELFNIGNRFFTIIPEAHSEILLPQHQIKKVILVSGQGYYSLVQKRKQLNLKDVAIIRVQQIAPFPYEFFKKQVSGYQNAKFIWFQQQQRNSGAWTYLEPRILLILEELKKQGLINSSQLSCVSRKICSSPAVGKKKKHDEEQLQILAKVFS